MFCPQIAILVLIAANCGQGQVIPKDVTDILSSHNNFRANVDPIAADMIEMVKKEFYFYFYFLVFSMLI
jgi:hypothetical protein